MKPWAVQEVSKQRNSNLKIIAKIFLTINTMGMNSYTQCTKIGLSF